MTGEDRSEPAPAGEPTWNDATEALQRHIEQGYAAQSPQVQQALVKALDALTSDGRATVKPDPPEDDATKNARRHAESLGTTGKEGKSRRYLLAMCEEVDAFAHDAAGLAAADPLPEGARPRVSSMALSVARYYVWNRWRHSSLASGLEGERGTLTALADLLGVDLDGEAPASDDGLPDADVLDQMRAVLSRAKDLGPEGVAPVDGPKTAETTDGSA